MEGKNSKHPNILNCVLAIQIIMQILMQRSPIFVIHLRAAIVLDRDRFNQRLRAQKAIRRPPPRHGETVVSGIIIGTAH